MRSLFEGPDIRTPTVDKSLGQLTKMANNPGLKPINLNAGGFSTNFSKGGRLTVGSSGQRQGLVNNLASTSLSQAGLLRGLRGQVTDAVSGLKATRLAEIDNARKASVSNLRDNLARRRILGSSFAEDALTRSELEFGQARDKVAAESFLQELDLKNELINQEFDARRTAFATRLDNLNLEADLAANLSSQAAQILSNNAQLKAQLLAQSAQLNTNLSAQQAQLDAEASAGAGAFLGKIAGTVFGPAGSAIGEKIGSSVGSAIA